MTRLSLKALMILVVVSGTAFSQGNDPVRCAITVYQLNREEDGHLIKSVEFIPKMGEEELTNRTLRLPGSRLFVIASVFPTDESMASAQGPDSIRLGLAVSRKKLPQAFDASNNAIAEATLYEAFDTARVETNTYGGRKHRVVRLECWDPRRERKQVRNSR